MGATPTDPEQYPYTTRLEVRHGPLELVDVQAIADACSVAWYNESLCEVNDSVVRVGVIQGEYHWHHHADDDEFFYVVDGRLLIDLEERTVELGPRQGFVVPKGVRHRTRAPTRTIILMVETKGIVPTGSTGIPDDVYREIAEAISSDTSPVGIDAKKTHVMILHSLARIEERLRRIEASRATGG